MRPNADVPTVGTDQPLEASAWYAEGRTVLSKTCDGDARGIAVCIGVDADEKAGLIAEMFAMIQETVQDADANAYLEKAPILSSSVLARMRLVLKTGYGRRS